MVRVLLGAVLPLVGLGLAAASVGPTLVGPSRGETMVVAGADAAAFQPASFDGSACASPLFFGQGENLLGLRAIALTVQLGEDGLILQAREIPLGTPAGEAALVLLIDESGGVVAAGDPAAYAASFSAADCLQAGKPGAV